MPKKTSKENDSKTKYVVAEKDDFEEVKGYEKTLENVTLESKIKEIPQESFLGFNKLKGVSLSENCKKIGASAFYSCTKLEKVDLSSIKNAEAIGTGAFSHCNSLKSVILPPISNRSQEVRAREIKNKVLEQVGNSVAESITFTNDPDKIKK